MEREIKFEYGFKSINGILKKVYALSEIPFISTKCDVWDMLSICYVRQFTGLKDKNGVDIYEGDLIEIYKNKNGLLTVNFQNSYVGGWVLTYKEEPPLSLGARNFYNLEVKGNIYENKELINA